MGLCRHDLRCLNSIFEWQQDIGDGIVLLVFARVSCCLPIPRCHVLWSILSIVQDSGAFVSSNPL